MNLLQTVAKSLYENAFIDKVSLWFIILFLMIYIIYLRRCLFRYDVFKI